MFQRPRSGRGKVESLGGKISLLLLHSESRSDQNCMHCIVSNSSPTSNWRVPTGTYTQSHLGSHSACCLTRRPQRKRQRSAIVDRSLARMATHLSSLTQLLRAQYMQGGWNRESISVYSSTHTQMIDAYSCHPAAARSLSHSAVVLCCFSSVVQPSSCLHSVLQLVSQAPTSPLLPSPQLW